MATALTVAPFTNAFACGPSEILSRNFKFICSERLRLPAIVKRTKNRGVKCRAEIEDGEGLDDGKQQLERILQNEETKEFVDSLAQKMLDDEESKELLKDLAAATERVEKAKRELERTNRLEQEILFVENQMARIIAEQNLADALVLEGERDVQEAEAELRAAELALVTARAGVPKENVGDESEVEEFSKDLERIESGKAAAVSVIAGTLSSLPFLPLSGDGIGLGSLLSVGGIMASCALYGVTYRYIIRRDLKNLHLKSGAAAAFALVRGIAQVDTVSRQVGFPGQGGEQVLMAALRAGESVFVFIFATLAIDYCISSGLLSPYPSRKR
ncbi:hypothetical protein R1flu_019958 [Riccia fluitans]|uniref:Uncharacterized protein n=1 Tax=Riccia fluitans TaxID=41844 RepID=A0ABD1ZLK0_9MARC